ncbi:MAG: hypothetical protein ACLFRN_09990, partial [Halothece sp.]
MADPNTNKKINELKREMQRVYEDVKALKVDIEPGGHITEGFDRLSDEMDSLREELSDLKSEVRKGYHQHSHQINQVLARQEVMLEAF